MLQQGKRSDWGLCGVATGWSFVKCNCSDMYKGFVCDNADRVMVGVVYNGVARPFDGRNEQ